MINDSSLLSSTSDNSKCNFEKPKERKLKKYRPAISKRRDKLIDSSTPEYYLLTIGPLRNCQDFSHFCVLSVFVEAELRVTRNRQTQLSWHWEVIVGCQLSSVVYILFAQAHFLWNFLGRVRITKKSKNISSKDFKRTNEHRDWQKSC